MFIFNVPASGTGPEDYSLGLVGGRDSGRMERREGKDGKGGREGGMRG